MKKPFLPAIAAVILAVSTPAAAAEKMTVLLDWFVNPDHGRRQGRPCGFLLAAASCPG